MTGIYLITNTINDKVFGVTLIDKYKNVEKLEFNFNYELEENEEDEENVSLIVKRKNISMKPMDEEEAILQIELLNHDFFVFKNIDEECVSVIYKRKDGRWEARVVIGYDENNLIYDDKWVVTKSDEDYTIYEKAFISERFNDDYSNHTIIGDPTVSYNCHGYSFGIYQGTIPCKITWFDELCDSAFISITNTDSLKFGDIAVIRYKVGEGYDPGSIHSSIVVNKDMLISKWGDGPLTKHYKYDLTSDIYNFDDTLHGVYTYYRREANTQINGADTFNGNGTYTFAPNVEIESFDIILPGFPTGTITTDTSGIQKSQFRAGETFQVRIPKNAVETGDINGRVLANVNTKSYPIFYGKTYDSKLQNYAITADPIMLTNSSKSLTLQGNTASIKIKKIDTDTNEPIANTVFQLSKQDGSVIGTVTTNSSGIATFNNLYQGNYLIKEITANNNYVLSSEVTNVTATYNQTTNITITNEKKKGQIKVVKIDKDNNETRLPGIEFEIRDANGNIVDKITTDNNGEATSKRLPINQDYTIRETKTLNNYVLNQEVQTVHLQQDQITTKTFENEKRKGQIYDHGTYFSLNIKDLEKLQNGESLNSLIEYIDKKKSTDNAISDDFLLEWRELLLNNIYFDLEAWLTAIKAENQQVTHYVHESDSLQRKLSLKASQGGRRIVVIWLPERMKTEMANKLLKLIEEPPTRTNFLLVSQDPDMVLGTIQSRVQRIHIQGLPETDIAEALHTLHALPHEQAQLIAHVAQGNYTEALKRINAGNEEQIFFNHFVQLMRLSYMRNIREMKKWSDDAAELGRERQKRLLAYCQRLIRENFIYNFHKPEMTFQTAEEAAFSAKSEFGIR